MIGASRRKKSALDQTPMRFVAGAGDQKVLKIVTTNPASPQKIRRMPDFDG